MIVDKVYKDDIEWSANEYWMSFEMDYEYK